MKQRTLDGLPDEVILRIFIKGCEEISDTTIPFRQSARLRKPLVKVARQVCKRWRTIIDNYPYAKSKSFWTSHIKLTALDQRIKKPSEPTLAKSLAKFRRLLESSDGCDLTIYFEINLLTTISAMLDLTSPPSLPVRLMARAMELMRPYHSQITTMRMQTNEPRLSFHLLDQIANRWDHALRTTEIHIDEANFNHPESVPRVPRVLNNLLGSSVIHFPASFAHLPNLDTLVIPGASWLTRASNLQIPMTINHLKLMDVHASSVFELHRFLTQKPLLHTHLQSIVLGMRPLDLSSASGWSWNRNDWVAPRTISLPCLHTLTLRGATGEELCNFFHSSYFPLLDTISLWIFEEDSTKWQGTPTPFPRLAPLDRLRAAMSPSDARAPDRHKHPQLPLLQKLEIVLMSPSATLSFLSIFAGWPIEMVSIRVDLGVEFPEELASSDTWLQGMSGLSNFCPRHLVTDLPSPLLTSILKSINPRFLKRATDAKTSIAVLLDPSSIP